MRKHTSGTKQMIARGLADILRRMVSQGNGPG